MATYKTSELFNKLSELINDGYEYVDIICCEADDEFSESLAFEAIASDVESLDFEDVESCEIPDGYDVESSEHTFNINDFCALPFTYKEIFSLMNAVDNALEYLKECVDKPENKSLRSEIKQSSVECRNLQAKFRKFTKNFKPL